MAAGLDTVDRRPPETHVWTKVRVKVVKFCAGGQEVQEECQFFREKKQSGTYIKKFNKHDNVKMIPKMISKFMSFIYKN
jgi:hypothetical protein